MNLSHFQVHHPKRRRKRKRKSTGHKSNSSVLHSQSRKREKPLTRKNLSTLLKASSPLPFHSSVDIVYSARCPSQRLEENSVYHGKGLA
ncbi:hypothetical protein TNCT_244321 [Trichonephila clavata]|uniref:Uncharacterized protein n=1 Tax=Trichonephila clavata TaxID=2740835 RepID=A0A8X6FT03_TRICU|nr:hypothetical protein TNCT_244321 [Trichonephila clavata]